MYAWSQKLAYGPRKKDYLLKKKLSNLLLPCFISWFWVAWNWLFKPNCEAGMLKKSFSGHEEADKQVGQ